MNKSHGVKESSILTMLRQEPSLEWSLRCAGWHSLGSKRPPS